MEFTYSKNAQHMDLFSSLQDTLTIYVLIKYKLQKFQLKFTE